MALTKAAFYRLAKLRADATGTSVRKVIEEIALGRFESSVVNGETLIATGKDSFNAQFTIPAGLGPGDIINLATEVLEWIERQPNPDNPGAMQTVRRLRACFDRARY